ncbi:MAG: hypothetical protein ABI765_07050, partial [Gemmatimonadota bacterium]
MFHSALSVILGYAAMVAVVIVGTMLSVRFILGKSLAEMKQTGSGMGAGPMTRPYLMANLVVSAIAAFVGGTVTGHMASAAPLYHGLALAVVMVLMSLVSIRQAGNSQ